jgi:hypothetical protein
VYWNVAFDFGVMLMQFRDQATSYNPKKAHCAVIRGLVGSNALETVSITNWFNSLNPVKVKRMRLVPTSIHSETTRNPYLYILLPTRHYLLRVCAIRL